MNTSRISVFSALVLGGFAASCHPIGPPGTNPSQTTGRHHGSPVLDPTPAPLPSAGPSAPPVTAPDTPAPAVAERPIPSKPPVSASAPAAEKPSASAAAQPKPAAPAKDSIPTAEKAPGKPGYVLSPYTGKLMLVRGIPSGVVVPDQTSPDSGKQFRVP